MSSQASSETFIDMTFLKFYLIANFECQTTKTVKQYKFSIFYVHSF